MNEENPILGWCQFRHPFNILISHWRSSRLNVLVNFKGFILWVIPPFKYNKLQAYIRTCLFDISAFIQLTNLLWLPYFCTAFQMWKCIWTVNPEYTACTKLKKSTEKSRNQRTTDNLDLYWPDYIWTCTCIYV